MESFHQMLDDRLGLRVCQGCKHRLWTGYSDGHIWEICLNTNCDYEEGSLDPAGYVMDQPVPDGPLPEQFESVDMPDKQPWQLPHETKYYRRKVAEDE